MDYSCQFIHGLIFLKLNNMVEFFFYGGFILEKLESINKKQKPHVIPLPREKNPVYISVTFLLYLFKCVCIFYNFYCAIFT